MANLFEEATPADVSFEEMIACVDRELKMRAQVYPRWVKDKKLTQEGADRQMLAMRAVRRRIMKAEAFIRAGEEVGAGLTMPMALAARIDAVFAGLCARYPEPPL